MNNINAITALRGGGTTYLHQICPISSIERREVSFCVTEISLFLENIQITSADLSLKTGVPLFHWKDLSSYFYWLAVLYIINLSVLS